MGHDVDARSGMVSDAVHLPQLGYVKGDIVIVFEGQLAVFRAIGEFTGEYEFPPSARGGTMPIDALYAGTGRTAKACPSARSTRDASCRNPSTCFMARRLKHPGARALI